MTAQRVAVIGGGWAGCAAAVQLAAGGAVVTLYEASRTLGGRARAVSSHGMTLDNGQHILLGAYRETLKLLRLTGIAEKSVLLRLPLQMCYPDGSGMEFIAARLPAPWHVGQPRQLHPPQGRRRGPGGAGRAGRCPRSQRGPLTVTGQ